jgi:hypothetical protein
MSINRTDYVIIGYKIPHNLRNKMGEPIDWFDDKFLPFVEGRINFPFSIILDHTSGDYAAYGKILARATDDIGFDGFKEIRFVPEDFDDVRDSFVDLFDDYDIGNVDHPRVLAFSNFN